jgi:hypothetical protein
MLQKPQKLTNQTENQLTRR